MGSRFDDTRMTPIRSGSPSPVRLAVGADGNRQLFEAAVAVADVEVLRGGKPVLGDAQAGRPVPEDHQPFRIRYGRGSSRSADATLKIAVLAPTPIAIEAMAASANPGAARNDRTA